MGRYADSMSALLMDQGRAVAQGQLGSGQAWGHFAEQLGQIPAQLASIREQQQREKVRQQEMAINEEELQRRKTLAAREAKQQKSAEQIQQESLTAYEMMKTGDVNAILENLRPEVRTVTEGWYKDFTGAKQARAKQDEELGIKTAKMLLAFADQDGNIDPVAAKSGIMALGDLIPAAKDMLQYTDDPVALRKVINHFATLGEKPAADYTLGSGRFSGATNQQIATAPEEAPKEPANIEAALLAATRAGDGAEQRRLLNLKAQMNAAGRAPTETGKIWVMRNGKPIRISESEYQPGDTPASTREQGRPVTSGDAGRFAELKTSLDDLKVLRATVFPDADLNKDTKTTQATGTLAKVQASIPNWATEMLGGWGAGAKQRQAVIDRVKQVIGKALEGGVLRKEDELKYERILPTIYDPPEVVRTKLDGIDTAISLRLQRDIDAREDAGYDVSKFRAREESQSTGGTQQKPIPGIPGGIAESTDGGKTWKRVK